MRIYIQKKSEHFAVSKNKKQRRMWMKISKVNHTRTAVGEEKQRVSGMLYHYPNVQKMENQKLKEHVKEYLQKHDKNYNLLESCDVMLNNEEIVNESGNYSFIIPGKSLNELLKILDDTEDEVEIG